MRIPDNPFVYDQAHVFPPDLIAEYYIDDHNHGRLLRSRRNIFLIGERGSGKTMALLYNSLPIQRIVAKNTRATDQLSFVGALIPANTPLTHRREHGLLDPYQASVASEHFLSLAIVFHLSAALRSIVGMVTEEESAALRSELEFYFGFSLPGQVDVFEAVCQVAQRESVEAQRALNRPGTDVLYPQSLSFASLGIPFMRAVRKIAVLKDSHFMLMVDDAHTLNQYQVRALNSWIAYRDRSLFSFKVATARVGQASRTTGSGGDILEGHDFVPIDMERPIHNEASDFGKFAEKVVARRLERVGILKSPSEFFPVHPNLAMDLEAAGEIVRARAEQELRGASAKRIGDYVYRQKWAEYVRMRGPRANRPLYSGFSTMVFLSTGVVRNLLEPCWWMWDAVIAGMAQEDGGGGMLDSVSPSIQAGKIMERSEAAWQRLSTLDLTIDGCSHDDGRRVRTLFEELAVFFRKRLLGHGSEPGATSFSLSGRAEGVMARLQTLLDIAQKAQLLYVRMGSAKAEGRRESYYVPNRMLWPSRGLDPHGQYARASIKAVDLLNAAEGKPIPFGGDDGGAQGGLFSREGA